MSKLIPLHHAEARAPVPASAWAPPDMSVLNESRRAAPSLPLEVFDGWADWIATTGEGCGAPADYVACALLAGAAGLIGNARRVSPWAGWSETCALWVLLVGKPSSGKSPAMDPIIGTLRKMEAGLAADHDGDLLRWNTEAEVAALTKEQWEKDVAQAIKNGTPPPEMSAAALAPEKPTRPRLAVSDATPEALAQILAGHPRGVLSHRDELAGWLAGFDRYGNGGERAFWLEAFGGRPYVLDRVKHDRPLLIPALTVSVLGGIQPDRLAGALLSGDDDGLSARFLVTWPEPVPPCRPRRLPDDRARAALERLLRLEMAQDEHGGLCPMVLPLTPEAADLFEKWRADHIAATDAAAGMLAGHFGKLPGVLLRLSLVLEHLWWCRSDRPAPDCVSLPAVAAAAGLVSDYFIPMAVRSYGDAAVPEADRLAAVLARWLVQTRPTTINARDLRRSVRLPGLKEASKVNMALEVLTDADWLRPAPNRDGGNAGRPKGDYVINPLIGEGRHE
jgi:putative DNA primase/helicase